MSNATRLDRNRDVPAISRRRFLGGVAAGLAAVSVAPPPAFAVRRRKRPNILWLVSEDNNPYLGAYGDRVARTPTLDRLAAEGIRYANYFSDAPVCAPSRFALITGIHPESCGPAHHHRAEGRIPKWLRGFPTFLRQAGYYCTNNFKTDYNAPIDLGKTWNERSFAAHWRNRPPGSPFFAVFNYGVCHETSTFNSRPAELRTRPGDVHVPAYAPDTPQVRLDKAHYYDVLEVMDAQIAERLKELDRDELADDTIVFYYSDNGGSLLRSKRFCYESGLHVPLIVRFPRRWAHLAPAAPGSVINAPITGIDLPATVLYLAGLSVPEYMQGVPFVDGSQRRRQYAFGMRNRIDERYDMQRTVRDTRYRYVRNYMPHLIYGQHVSFMWNQAGCREWEQRFLDGNLNEVQSRFWSEKPPEELYDLREDPDEVSNLARDPVHAERLTRMRRALDRHMVRVNDNGFIPEGSPLEGYNQSRAAGAYPLQEVMSLARTAIRREPGNLTQLVSHLGDGNEVMRYWAALGCSMLGERAASARGELEGRLTAEGSARVKVAVAEALARIGATERSVPYLADTLDRHEDPRVRLQAINALGNIGERARPALPAITRAANGNSEEAGQYVVQIAARYTERVLNGTYVPAP